MGEDKGGDAEDGVWEGSDVGSVNGFEEEEFGHEFDVFHAVFAELVALLVGPPLYGLHAVGEFAVDVIVLEEGIELGPGGGVGPDLGKRIEALEAVAEVAFLCGGVVAVVFSEEREVKVQAIVGDDNVGAVKDAEQGLVGILPWHGNVPPADEPVGLVDEALNGVGVVHGEDGLIGVDFECARNGALAVLEPVVAGAGARSKGAVGLAVKEDDSCHGTTLILGCVVISYAGMEEKWTDSAPFLDRGVESC